MKQIISLKVPAEPKAESVSHGPHDAELEPGSTIEVSDERFADFLVSEYDLEEVDRREVKTDEPGSPEAPPVEVDEESYPEDLPGRDALIEANVPLSTARTLSAEQLVEYKGIGSATAERIVKYFAAGGHE
jgi:hypothetical protein